VLIAPDVDGAPEDLGEPLDIAREDLDALIEAATARAPNARLPLRNG
jgi:hypothetical protein